MKIAMERELIGRGYYALDVDAAKPTQAVSDFVTQAFREAFSIPYEQIRVVSAEDAQKRRYQPPVPQRTVNGER